MQKISSLAKNRKNRKSSVFRAKKIEARIVQKNRKNRIRIVRSGNSSPTFNVTKSVNSQKRDYGDENGRTVQ